MEQLARAQQWISSLNTPSSPTANDLAYNSYFNKSAPNSSSNSQSLSRSASIYGQSPVNRPPNFHLPNQLAGGEQQTIPPNQEPNKQPSVQEYGYQQQVYDAEQAAYAQDKAAYDYAMYNHQMQLYNNYQQQLAAQQAAQAAAGGQQTSPVSSHNTSFFYDNAMPPYPHTYQNQQQVF